MMDCKFSRCIRSPSSDVLALVIILSYCSLSRLNGSQRVPLWGSVSLATTLRLRRTSVEGLEIVSLAGHFENVFEHALAKCLVSSCQRFGKGRDIGRLSHRAYSRPLPRMRLPQQTRRISNDTRGKPRVGPRTSEDAACRNTHNVSSYIGSSGCWPQPLQTCFGPVRP